MGGRRKGGRRRERGLVGKVEALRRREEGREKRRRI